MVKLDGAYITETCKIVFGLNMKKIVSLAFVLVFLSTAVFVGFVRPAVAEKTIYIRSDGSVEGTDKIQRDGVVYTFTANIYDEIVVERDNIVVDGAGYTLQGGGDGTGIYLSGRSNVTAKNTKITGFTYGISLFSSSDNTISHNTVSVKYNGIIVLSSSNNTIFGNNVSNNDHGIFFESSSDNTISGNNITGNNFAGILLFHSLNNAISGNKITNNYYGIGLHASSNYNRIYGNNITENVDHGIGSWNSSKNSIFRNNITNNSLGIVFSQSSNHIIYHNNFMDNTEQVHSYNSTNVWDNGIEGNYWSDYTGEDQNGDGIGDTPYVIDENNQDNYPLMSPWSPPPVEEDVPFWMQWLFWAIVAAGIVVLAGAVYFLKKRKPPTPNNPARVKAN